MCLEQTLREMGNTIGRIVQVDMTTTVVTRGCFARVCVELDLQRPLIPIVMIMGRVVQVEYESLPRIYFQCGLYGHRTDLYPTLNPPLDPNAPTTNDLGDSSRMMVEKTKQTGPYGPWMMPSHVRQRYEQTQHRMQSKCIPSKANQRLNKQLDREAQAGRQDEFECQRVGSGRSGPKISPETCDQLQVSAKSTDSHSIQGVRKEQRLNQVLRTRGDFLGREHARDI